MADPRITPGYDGARRDGMTFIIDDSTITFDATKAGGSAAVGKAVTLSAGGTIALCADADPVLGKLESVEWDKRATVIEGPGAYVTLPGGDSATLTVGTKIVGALGPDSAKGYIRSTSSSEATAVEAQLARHTIIHAGTTTAVVVRLD